jgi:hypothetical protein
LLRLAAKRKECPKYLRPLMPDQSVRPREAQEPKTPSRPAYKKVRAQQAIRALWPPNGVVPEILGNGPLCKKVAEWIEEDCKRQNVPQLSISDDTILRAAGRSR